jgi:hypothetical protein
MKMHPEDELLKNLAELHRQIDRLNENINALPPEYRRRSRLTINPAEQAPRQKD